jgi:prepilin-type N-terminal cleavage/methylation domain-containing protein
MRLDGIRFSRSGRCRVAFTLIELMVGVAVMGLLAASLYAGLSYGFAVISLSREEERATQILAQRMEVVRLLNWDQVANLPGYIPTTFTDCYASANPTNVPGGSLLYHGTVLVTNAPVTESYADQLRMIQIRLTWQSGNRTHSRQMTTFVSQYGLQRYVY